MAAKTYTEIRERAEEFVDQLLTKEALEQPSDKHKPDDITMELPEWYDEKQFNKARNFYNENCFSLSSSMILGLIAVFSVPSILRVLMSSRRSNSVYTAYRRYLSTILHTITWFEHELKPGTLSWKSLYTVRRRHARATISSKAKGVGMVSQRDMALTQFTFFGFSILRPDFFGIRQLTDGDWEAYNHFWRVIGHMIGLEDRYNLCRSTIEETREVCQIVQDRVYTPCLENVPEYFEHMARVMIDGLWYIHSMVHQDTDLYMTRYLAGVPGYIYTERDRIELQSSLKKHLNGKSLDVGVETTSLILKPAVDGLPDVPPRLLYYNDYNTIDTAPAYKQLSFKAKYKLVLYNIFMTLYTTYLGRLYFNMTFKVGLYLMRYFPYMAFVKFGIRESLVNIFTEDPIDNTKPKTNAEYTKPNKPKPWYMSIFELLW